MASVIDFGVFGDDVYSSTDLNRRAGEVLNRARERPVTISRNNEQFALLKRDHAAKLFRAVNTINYGTQVLSEAHSLIQGAIPLNEELAWLSTFDKGDLQKLFSEVLGAMRRASNGTNGWEGVTNLIHEWKVSALVAQDGVLDEAMFGPEDRQKLPDPRSPDSVQDLEESPECMADL